MVTIMDSSSNPGCVTSKCFNLSVPQFSPYVKKGRTVIINLSYGIFVRINEVLEA